MMGPAGPRGERGSAGAEGPPGLPGVPGSPGNDVSVPPWRSCNQATPSLAVRGGHERFFTSICPTYKCTDTADIFTASRVRVLAFHKCNVEGRDTLQTLLFYIFYIDVLLFKQHYSTCFLLCHKCHYSANTNLTKLSHTYTPTCIHIQLVSVSWFQHIF